MLNTSKRAVSDFIKEKHSLCTNLGNSFPYSFCFKDKKPIFRYNILFFYCWKDIPEFSMQAEICYVCRNSQTDYQPMSTYKYILNSHI